MPIRLFKCPACGYERRSLREKPRCNHNQEEEGIPLRVAVMGEILVAPETKFMEPRDKERGKSIMKDQEKLLKERAKEHARANDYHDLIQNNTDEMAKRVGWVNDKGRIKTKVEDK